VSYSFYVGLDLGQAADYSALAVIEEPIWSVHAGRWASSTTLQRDELDSGVWQHWQKHAPGKPPLWLRMLHRYPLQTPYPTVVADVIRRLGGSDPRDDAVLVVDGTGVGAAVVDMFRFSDLPCPMYSVVIHGGVKVERNHVPKRDLISAVQVLLHTERLQVAKQSEMTETWAAEMQNYRMKLTDNGHDTYDARGDSKHDDLVLAVALASWFRGRINRGE